MEQITRTSLVLTQWKVPISSVSSDLEDVKHGRAPVRRGEACPRCEVGRLDYNGLLDLECPACGYSEGSGAGCT